MQDITLSTSLGGGRQGRKELRAIFAFPTIFFYLFNNFSSIIYQTIQYCARVVFPNLILFTAPILSSVDI